jgi:crotonobetainyl-CoA:carnitine CoA-transferase CaiB-like acyl-CoA transferase
MWMMATDVQTCLVTGLAPAPMGRLVPNPLWNHYRAKDGKWFHLVMLQADRYWARFCEAIERPELTGDERWANVFVRAQNSLQLVELLDAHFASRPLSEWTKRFDRAEMVWAPVQTISDVVADPQALALEAFTPLEHRSGDTVRIVRSPIEFSATPASIRHGAPELGEHTEEVLLEKGYTWDDIAALKEKGAIG